MELMLDFNINGEILIPLENNSLFPDKKELTYKDIYECSYDKFRNVLFQGELVKIFIILKSGGNIQTSRLKNFFDNIYFKIEFENTEAIKINDEIKAQNKNIDQTLTLERNSNDLFTINSEKINEKNYEYEKVERKIFDENESLEIYELYKQIIVPKSFINNQLILKLQILKKNEDEVDFTESSDTYLYYKTGHFSNIQKFKILKTLFKEIKVIRPFEISETKQTDLTLELSLLQININNITAQTQYEDISLKNSKFLKKMEQNNEKKVDFGNDIIIKEIEVLEDETTIDDKETEKIEKIIKYLRKKNSLMQKDMNFKLMEKNFPILIQPGEEYTISVKVKKNSFLSESSLNLNSQIIENPAQIENTPVNEPKPKKKELNIIQKIVQRIDSLPNQIKSSIPLNTETPMPIPEIYQKTLGNKISQKNTNTTEGNKTEVSFKELMDENIEIFYITPVLLYISSKMFYEDLFMSLQLKWNQKFNRYLKIELKLPENIYLYEFFDVGVKIRNISSAPMNLLIEMKENENENQLISNKANNFEYMPFIISQTKSSNLGMFNCNEDKIFKLKFLAIKLGFTQLPNFAITDTITKRRFYIVQNNKIFIQENADGKSEGKAINRLISKSFAD